MSISTSSLDAVYVYQSSFIENYAKHRRQHEYILNSKTQKIWLKKYNSVKSLIILYDIHTN